MRSAELIHIAVFSFLGVLAWIRPLPGNRRTRATVIGIIGLGANILAGAILPRVLPALAASVVRDWLPAALVLLVYRQAGEFFVKVNEGFQDSLERMDARTLGPLLNWLSRGSGQWIAGSLELAYLLCYPMVPMSMGALYVLRLARYADSFWTVVLVSTYFSYGAVPFLQALPPRVLDEPWHEPLPLGPVRRFNLWILRNASIHANTFPSAHVAASTGAALFLMTVAPLPVGLVFLAIALGITFGTFTGRYHFAADAVTGSALAAIVFLIVRQFRGF
jgi:hypothetical protein